MLYTTHWKRKQVNEARSDTQLTPTHLYNAQQQTASFFPCINNVYVCLWARIQGVRCIVYLSYCLFLSFYLLCSVSVLLRIVTYIFIFMYLCTLYMFLCLLCFNVFRSLWSFRMESALFFSGVLSVCQRERIVFLTSTILRHTTSSQSSFSIQM